MEPFTTENNDTSLPSSRLFRDPRERPSILCLSRPQSPKGVSASPVGLSVEGWSDRRLWWHKYVSAYSGESTSGDFDLPVTTPRPWKVGVGYGRAETSHDSLTHGTYKRPKDGNPVTWFPVNDHK